MNLPKHLADCMKKDEMCSIQAKHLSRLCHDIGQELYVYGLYSSTIDLSRNSNLDKEAFSHMSHAIHSIEKTIRKLHELTHLYSKTTSIESKPISLNLVFLELKSLSDEEEWELDIAFYDASIETDRRLFFRLLRLLTKITQRHSADNRCAISCRRIKNQVRIYFKPYSCTIPHQKIRDELDVEIARVLADKLGFKLQLSTVSHTKPYLTLTLN